MQQSFLEEVVANLSKKYPSLENLIFVLPSKRAGTFVRNSILKSLQKTIFAPEIFSIEAFVEHISGISYATNTEQLFELYKTYGLIHKGEKDSFYVFSKWGQTLLQDFNEIDRYLIATDQLFSNLSAIQEMSIWSPEVKKTKMMEDYLSFWNQLDELYHAFNNSLLSQGIGHQGLVYREACNQLPAYLENNKDKTHIFIGFNALNTAESKIIQTILADYPAEIYWDIDKSFLDDSIHDAGLFIRQHRDTWDHIKNNGIAGLSSHYTKPKNVEIIGIPKNISQAKYVGSLLAKLYKSSPALLKNTAVVLGEETLLNPILNAIPEELPDVNITMGYPLGKTPLAGLFDQFFNLYINQDTQGWFYRPLLDFLAHPYINLLFSQEVSNEAAVLSHKIKNNNWTYITTARIRTATDSDSTLTNLLVDQKPTPLLLVEKCSWLLLVLKEKLSESSDTLAIEYVYRFYTLFNQLRELLEQHQFITDIKSLLGLYRELLSSITLDFQGEPLQGLQIMGMLESRNLDFETVILTSVNEGILPSGKSNNSFIPFDLKKYFGLPTYKEKDAVYTYHFYRLLQRAKNVYLLYNTEPDVLEGGEPSRLIRQLLTDELRQTDTKEHFATAGIKPIHKTLETIQKDASLLRLIQTHAGTGFSPTSLTNYIRNPIDFYKHNLLKIDDVLEVEETVAANTFGTIVHDTLEELYMPFVGSYLSEELLKNARSRSKQVVQKHFEKTYKEGDITRGKNLIAFHVVARYIENFIDRELEEIQKHQIKILALEQKMERKLILPELSFPAVLKGKLDRIDCIDGMTRIIDYKTGKVTGAQVEIFDWDTLKTDYDHSKAFQLLCYALMYEAKEPTEEIQAGIISFKNLASGVLSFATKEKKGSRKKSTIINRETRSQFQEVLHQLVLEICNPDIPFQEKLIP